VIEVEQDVDTERLAERYRSNTALRAAIDYLAGREREPRNGVTRARILQGEIAGGGDFTLEDSLSVLEVLARSGCGELQNGRPKAETRLKWQVSALEMARSVQRAGASPPEAEEGADANGKLFESHMFPVRPGVSMPLRLRKDLSADELNNLAEFVKVVARARQTP
jgi:hypothetical protein